MRFWDFDDDMTYDTFTILSKVEIKDLTAFILIVCNVSKRGVFETEIFGYLHHDLL